MDKSINNQEIANNLRYLSNRIENPYLYEGFSKKLARFYVAKLKEIKEGVFQYSWRYMKDNRPYKIVLNTNEEITWREVQDFTEKFDYSTNYLVKQGFTDHLKNKDWDLINKNFDLICGK